MPSRKARHYYARRMASVSVAKKKKMLGKIEQWLKQSAGVTQSCRSTPLRRPRKATRPLIAVPRLLAILRGFETLPRTIAQAKAFAILWWDGGGERTGQSLKNDSRFDKRSLKIEHLRR